MTILVSGTVEEVIANERLVISGVGAAAAASVPQHVRGTVLSVSGPKVTIRTASGPVSDRRRGTPTSRRQTPAILLPACALEVVVFPKSMAGTGEGNYPWDLPPPHGSSMSSMTNGTVTMRAMSSMTNATVTHVVSGQAKTVTLTRTSREAFTAHGW